MIGADEWRWLGGARGDCADHLREVDWARTAVGAVALWSPSLKTLVSTILHARQPMLLWWGPEFVQFYNDAYVPSLGLHRHPSALGQRGRDCWADMWPAISPEIEGVLTRGQATLHEDRRVPIVRHGRMDEAYWSYGYSPAFELDGSTAGVLVVVRETTTRVVAQRRLLVARSLAERLGAVQEVDELAGALTDELARSPEDAPWSLVYRAVPGAGAPRLLAFAGVDRAQAEAVVAHVERAPHTAELQSVAFPAVDALPGTPWPEPSTGALHAPVHLGDRGELYGRLVVGVSPRVPDDEAYRKHLAGLIRQLQNTTQALTTASARRAAEGARNDLLMQAPVAAALLVGPQWRYELANQLYERLVGRKVVGKDWHAVFPELTDSPVDAILRRVYDGGEAFFASEQLVSLARESDGVIEDRFFDFNMIPIRAQDGRVEAMMVVAVEMTAQVTARRDLERTAGEREALVLELRRLARTKDEFLAMLGHELRNPLAPISTALRLIAQRGDGGHAREHAIIERQVEHLTRLVDDLLDVSRITSGKVKLVTHVVELVDVVARALELTSPLFEQRHQTVDVSVPQSGLGVRVDVARMTQVIGNLLTNASKYGMERGRIQVRAARRGDDVVVEVEDEGIGIDADTLPHVFELFTQAKQASDRTSGGLGLGLAIVRNLMTLHDGTVSVASPGLEQGSVFTLALPFAEGVTTQLRDSTPPPNAQPAREARRVLIVDDNEDAAEMLAELLQALGHVTTVANDGPAALATAHTFAPDVALLDIGLPVMDGYELARRLRATGPGKPLRLYALTGYGQPEDRRRALEAGFDGHFVKPVNLDEIAKVVKGTPSLLPPAKLEFP